MNTKLSRRTLLAGGASLAALGLAACSTPRQTVRATGPRFPDGRLIPAKYLRMYAAITDEPYYVPAVNLSRLEPRYCRQVTDAPPDARGGTIVVNTADRFLYLVRGDGSAIRYGIGVGREGFAWEGKGHVGRKAVWPTWTPPKSMVARDEEAAKWAAGMPPGPTNPLGARALYIYDEHGRDTLYRLHGNPDETSIGRAVSSGCIRLLQQDIIDLYSRVPVGTDVIVRQAPDSTIAI